MQGLLHYEKYQQTVHVLFSILMLIYVKMDEAVVLLPGFELLLIQD